MKAHTTDKDKPAAGNEQASRRQFLQRSGGLVAGAALTSGLAARSYAGEDNTIRVALVGCGGRGTGAAANAL
ncbi:MAG TPA: twin-arginine translocation signal domain-containing protein, partial [Planctomycetaceae bacterium]|nr:twin-arginine translocation signal domain-containing protein [Planctomycetaceae bacterium]